MVIGQYGSLTGSSATFGISTKNGIELATDEINAKGGISGMPLRMVVEDDQGKPEEAATAVNKLISRDRPVALLGEVSSSRSLAAAPIAQKNGVPMISPSSTSVKVTQQGDYIFRVCFIDPFQGTVAAKFAYNSKGIRKIAILKDVKNDYSVGLAQFFNETFVKLGGTVTGDEAYSEGDNDFKAQLTKLIAGQPEALFVPGYYTEVGLIAKQARQLGFTGPLIGGDGWDSDELVKIGEDAIIGSYFTNHYSVDDPTPAVQNFIRNYEAKYQSKPDGLAALGYDAAVILYAALNDVAKDPAMAAALGDRSSDPAKEEAKKAARSRLRQALAQTKNFPGVTGVITIDADRNANKAAVVVEVTKAGPKFVESVPADGGPAGSPNDGAPPPTNQAPVAGEAAGAVPAPGGVAPGGPPPGPPPGGPPPGAPGVAPPPAK